MAEFELGLPLPLGAMVPADVPFTCGCRGICMAAAPGPRLALLGAGLGAPVGPDMVAFSSREGVQRKRSGGCMETLSKRLSA